MTDIQETETPAADGPTLPANGLQRQYIDGKFVENNSGPTFTSLNRTTNEVLACAPRGAAAEIDRAVTVARRAFDEGPWPRMKASERAKTLQRIADAIHNHAGEFINHTIYQPVGVAG